MSWFKKIFGKKEMSNVELLQQIHTKVPSQKAQSLLTDRDHLSQLMLHFGYSLKAINERWAKQPRPGEVLLEMLEKEPDYKKLVEIVEKKEWVEGTITEEEHEKYIQKEKTKTTFVPDDEKHFDGAKVGDVFCSSEGKGYNLIRIVCLEMIQLKGGRCYNLSGHQITAPFDDSFLSIGVSMSDFNLESVEQGRKVVESGTVNWKVMMVPMRPSGLRKNKRELVGNLPPDATTVNAYQQWKTDFEKGAAGSF